MVYRFASKIRLTGLTDATNKLDSSLVATCC